MANVNTIKTRILNKYDLLANYSNFTPLKGEICIAVVGETTTQNQGLNGDTTKKPIVGIKVGDGSTSFNNLPWIQAVAGDVSTFVKGIIDEAKFNELVNALIATGTAQLATKAELKTVSDKLDQEAAKIVTLRGIVETGDNSNEKLRAAINGVLGTASDNSSANTIYGAKKYAEEKADTAKQAAVTAAGTAADAKYELIGVAASKVKELSDSIDGKIGTTDYVGGTLTQAIANLQASVGTSGEGLGAQVEALKGRVDGHDTKIGNLETAVGNSTKGLVKDVADLQATIADNGNFGKRVVALESEMDVVQAATAGYDTSKTIAADIQVAKDAAASAQSKADTNEAAIGVLNGGKNTAGSVAHTAAAAVAEVVAGADANFDTLKEIADWIKSDTSGAAEMANDIAEMQGLLGVTEGGTLPKSVDTRISEAIAAENLAQYATDDELGDAVERIAKLETAIGAEGSVNDAIEDAKDEVIGTTGDAKTADTIYGAKAYADDAAAAAKSEAISEAASDAAGKYELKNVAKGLVDAEAEIARAAEKANADAITGLGTRIDNLDYTDEEDGVVATVTQTDGKIGVTHKKVGVADLADEVFVFYCGNATGYADDMKTVDI